MRTTCHNESGLRIASQGILYYASQFGVSVGDVRVVLGQTFDHHAEACQGQVNFLGLL